MRVLHVLAPAPYGGLEEVVLGLTRGLAQFGIEVHIAVILDPGCIPDAHPFVQVIDRGAIALHVIQAGTRAYIRERAEIRRLCEKLRPEIVHTHGYRADVIAGGAARAAGIFTVATAHGFTGGDFRNRCYETLQRRAFRSCDAVIAVSRPLQTRLASAGIKRNIQVIQNAWSGASDAVSRTDARQRLGLSRAGKSVGWVGRLSQEKAPDILLEAAPLVAARCEFAFIGDGPQNEALKRRAHLLGIADRTRFAGVIAGAGRLLSAFDVLVLSSRTEGSPIVLLEALAAGTPVVAARVGGIPDIIDDSCALLVEPEDPRALAAAIDNVFDHPQDAQARAQHGLLRLQQQFAQHAWVEKHISLYREVAHDIEAA